MRWLLLPLFGVLLVALAMVVFFTKLVGDAESSRTSDVTPSHVQITDASAHSVALEPTDPQAPDRVRLAVEPQTESTASSVAATANTGIRGRVVDDLGAPVSTQFAIEVSAAEADPRARSSQAGLLRGGGGIRAVDRVFTSPDGTFVFDGIHAGRWQVVAKGSGDVRSAAVLVHVADATEPVTLVLPRSASILGSVRGPQGTPIADAEIHLIYPGEDPIDFAFGETPTPRAKSGADGAFRVDGLLASPIRIMARRDGYPDGAWVRVTTLPGAEQAVELELMRGGRIEGVVDPLLGEVEGRRVDLISFQGSSGWAHATTDATGRFAFEAVIPQGYIVELRALGYGKPPPDGALKDKASLAEYNREQNKSIRKQIEVTDGETTQVTFAASTRSIVVRGAVTASGKPIADVLVDVKPVDGDDRGAQTVTSSDGRYELSLGQPGPHWFSLYASGGARAQFDREIPDVELVELSFEVSGGGISGRVVDADGHPVAYMPMTVVREELTGETVGFWDRFRSTNTDGKGEFEFGMLSSGSYTLRAPDGFFLEDPQPIVPHGCVVISDLRVDGTHVVDGLRVELPPECTILGQVTDPLGKPLGGVRIVIEDQAGRSIWAKSSTVTDATGTFRAPSVAPGRYSVVAEKDGRRASSAPFTAEVEAIANPTVVLP